ncbi:MAG TPA: recombinase family protein, partial [Candidatus Paceibacterota bacterium]|nr:recombinase family protein [Candidatus Paceibacterota bacterium]
MNTLDFTKLKPGNYNRKSSESEDKQMLSISSQKDEAKRISDFYKLPKFIEVFEESKSAKKEFLRPEFIRMIDMIKKGTIDSIVCWKLDRLARNMTEGGMLIDLISSGVLKAIITHDKVYYPSDNVLLMSVEFGQGKQFVKDLSVNVKRGQDKKARMGIPHGVASLGFLNDRTQEKGNRSWIVDESRLGVIKILLEMFLTGTYSAGKLHRYAIKELKLTTVKRKRIGGTLITLSRIYEILKDPIYAGFFIQNNERYELINSLPRLINEDQHIKIKNILAKKNIPKSQHNIATFAGFLQSENGEFIGQDVKHQLICDCKTKFSYMNKTHCPICKKDIEQLENPKYLTFIYYYNVRKKKSLQKYKSVSETEINKELLKFIDENLTFSSELADWSKKYITELKDKEINDSIFRKQKAETDKIEYENKKSRLRQMLRDEQITPEEYKIDLDNLNKQYYTIIDNKKEAVDWCSKMNEIVDLTQCAKLILEKGDIRAKRSILSKLGSNLVWNEEKLSIYNNNAINKLVKGIKDAKSISSKFEPKTFLTTQGLNEKTSEFSPVFSTLL